MNTLPDITQPHLLTLITFMPWVQKEVFSPLEGTHVVQVADTWSYWASDQQRHWGQGSGPGLDWLKESQSLVVLRLGLQYRQGEAPFVSLTSDLLPWSPSLVLFPLGVQAGAKK